MSTVAPNVFHVVTGELKCGKHLLVRKEPVATVAVVVVRAILQKDANRFRLCLPNQGRIHVATSLSNVGSNGAEHAAKLFRPFPSRRESTNGAGAGARNRPTIAVLGKVN